MIDDIVEMILKEARARKGEDYLENLYRVWDPIRDRVHLEIVETTRLKWREKYDRSNSGNDFKGGQGEER